MYGPKSNFCSDNHFDRQSMFLLSYFSKKAHVSFQRKSKIGRNLDFGSADRTVDLAPIIDFRDVKHAHFVVTYLSSSRNRRPFKTFSVQASSSCLKRSFRLYRLKGVSKRTKPKKHGVVVDKKPLRTV